MRSAVRRAVRGAGSARARAGRAAGLVVVASLGIQLSATTAHGLFARLGPPGVSGLRFAVAALVLLLVNRPRLRGRSREDWTGIAVFGAVLAVMNVCLYLALARLPLGLVVTLDFLGPFVVAVAGIRQVRALVWPAVGLAGIVLIAGPGGPVDRVGVVFALCSAAGFGLYTVLAGRIGGAGRGMGGLSVSVTVAAVLLLPVSVPVIPLLTWTDLGVLAVSGLVGVAIAFSADVTAVSLIGAPSVAVLFALDPLLAAVIGIGLLDETLEVATAAGIVLVAVAGGVTIRNAARPARTGAGAALSGPGRRRTGPATPDARGRGRRSAADSRPGRHRAPSRARARSGRPGPAARAPTA
jgi:inner membrane transporter RhtA